MRRIPTVRLRELGELLALLVMLTPLVARADTSQVEYAHDALNRLTDIWYISAGDTTFVTYTYDDGGNILTMTVTDARTLLTGVADAGYLFVDQPAPNPFSTRTGFRFELRATQNVTITIYDLRGRVVRRLMNQVAAHGTTHVFWDGRDGRGAAAASGVYFARVRTEYKTFNLRMLLVR